VPEPISSLSLTDAALTAAWMAPVPFATNDPVSEYCCWSASAAPSKPSQITQFCRSATLCAPGHENSVSIWPSVSTGPHFFAILSWILVNSFASLSAVLVSVGGTKLPPAKLPMQTGDRSPATPFFICVLTQLLVYLSARSATCHAVLLISLMQPARSLPVFGQASLVAPFEFATIHSPITLCCDSMQLEIGASSVRPA
jgi:hypothetical protein